MITGTITVILQATQQATLQATPQAPQDLILHAAQWFTAVAGAAGIIFGVLVFFYWLGLGSRHKFRFANFVLWPPASTKDAFLLKCKQDEKDTCLLNYDVSTFNTSGYREIYTPVVTVRGQIMNPFPWPQVIDDAELSIKRIATREGNEVLSGKELPETPWDKVQWRLFFLGGTKEEG